MALIYPRNAHIYALDGTMVEVSAVDQVNLYAGVSSGENPIGNTRNDAAWRRRELERCMLAV